MKMRLVTNLIPHTNLTQDAEPWLSYTLVRWSYTHFTFYITERENRYNLFSKYVEVNEYGSMYHVIISPLRSDNNTAKKRNRSFCPYRPSVTPAWHMILFLGLTHFYVLFWSERYIDYRIKLVGVLELNWCQ